MEEAHLYTIVGADNSYQDEVLHQAKAISHTRALLEALPTEMIANRAAPKLLGVLTLNETLIQAIIGAIATAGTAFVSSFLNGLVTAIGENSGLLPTMEPTMQPSDVFGATS